MKWIIGALIVLAFCAYGLIYMAYCIKKRQRAAGAGMLLCVMAAAGIMIIYLLSG